MATHIHSIKCTVAAFLLAFTFANPVVAQQTDLDTLFQELMEADEATHARIANRIRSRFEKSGSASMDLLLRRGADAADGGDYGLAIEHFTALIDHAPNFAEGYNNRASAYFSAGLIGPAIDDLRQTLVLNPRHFEAMFGVGIIMEELGKDDSAKGAFEAILEIYPLDPQAREALDRLELKTQGQAI